MEKRLLEEGQNSDFKKAEERAHILMGLFKPLGEIDQVIATIKNRPIKMRLIRIWYLNLNFPIFKPPPFWK